MKYILGFILCFISFHIQAQNRADSTLLRWLRADGMIEYKAETTKIYSNGTDKFAALFDDFRKAETSIDVEYFIFADDSISRLTLNELKAAADRGVKVRLIIDGYKDHARGYGYDGPRLDSLKKVGIDTRIFDPWRHPYIMHVPRDHRKVVVIDGKIGYTGGLNVADYYIVGKPDEYGGWRDTHIRLTGDAVKGLAWLFEKSWKIIETGKYKEEIEYLLPDSIRMPDICSDYANEYAKVVFFERSRENKKKKTETRRTIVKAFNSARDTIKFVTPYFVPTHTLRVAIDNALERGVVVQILISKVGDATLFNAVNYNVCKHYMKRGAQIFLYKGAFHHSKIMMVDNQYAMVGSANFNSRSMKWDYEESCFVFDRKTTAELTRIFEQDKLQCDTMTMELYKEMPKKKRILGWTARTFLTLFL